MTNSSSLLKDVYLDAISTIRHYDGQRATFTQLTLSALTVLAGLAIINAKSDSAPELLRGLAAVGVAISITALLVVAKLHQLIKGQRLRARLALTKLEGEGECPIGEIDTEVKARGRKTLLGRTSLRNIWSLIFVVYLIANSLVLLAPSTLFPQLAS